MKLGVDSPMNREHYPKRQKLCIKLVHKALFRIYTYCMKAPVRLIYALFRLASNKSIISKNLSASLKMYGQLKADECCF